MYATSKKRATVPVHQKLDRSFFMLSKSTEVDRFEIDKVHNAIKQSCDELSSIEKKYKIKSYRDSRKIHNFPLEERANILRLWQIIFRSADELDFLFIDEDLYHC